VSEQTRVAASRIAVVITRNPDRVAVRILGSDVDRPVGSSTYKVSAPGCVPICSGVLRHDGARRRWIMRRLSFITNPAPTLGRAPRSVEIVENNLRRATELSTLAS